MACPEGAAQALGLRSRSRWNHCVGVLLLAHRPHESHALTGERTDQPLSFAGVIDRTSGCVDTGVQSRF